VRPATLFPTEDDDAAFPVVAWLECSGALALPALRTVLADRLILDKSSGSTAPLQSL
jgi:hypothetical protein